MKFFTVPALLVAALLSAVVVVPFLPVAKPAADFFLLELRMSSNVTGGIQIFYDIGAGITEEHSLRANAIPTIDPIVYRLPLPPGDYHAFRLDLLDRGGSVLVESLQIVTQSGRVAHDFPPAQFTPAVQIESITPRDRGVQIVFPSGATDPQLTVSFDPPLAVRPSWGERLEGFPLRAFGVFVVLTGLLFALDRMPRGQERVARVGRHFAAKPVRAIWFVAALAVIASAYPVVFLGKSHVSPNFGAPLLYDGLPTLPGASAQFVDPKGSDIGAVLWEHVPFSVLEHRALFRDFELPLWDRYNSAGTPLLGQGQSMLGDPLHLIPVLANGAAWAWDVKYLLAKTFFAAGLGLLVLALLADQRTNEGRDQRTEGQKDQWTVSGSVVSDPLVPWSFGPLVPALAVSAAAPFIGFYLYRINHPAIFSLGYAPWVLLCWVRVAQAITPRETTGWCVGLIAASCALMNSGTVKEAYMLLLTMSFSGLCVLLVQDAPWRERGAKLAALAWSGVVFALLTAPLWLTFFDSLRGAYTAYNAPAAHQIQPSLLLGAFDELFYRPLTAKNGIFNPALNFLLLLGLLYFLATLRTRPVNRAALALGGSALVPLALAFGAVPPSWIVKVPFLANVTHIDNTFTCALLVLWSVLAGVGFAHAARRLASPEGRGDLAIVGLMLVALVGLWLGFRQAVHRSVLGAEMPTFAPVVTGAEMPVSDFVWASLALLLLASFISAITLRRALLRQRWSAAALLTLALCAVVMLWRHGLHAASAGFRDYVVRPATRANFHAPSGAIAWLREAHAREPGRGFGLHGNFFPGWSGVYALETIHGPDPVVNPFYRELIARSGLTLTWDWRIHLVPARVPDVRPFLDFLNVRHYLNRPNERAVMTRAVPLAHAADLDVYESASAWPRAFFSDRLETYANAADLVKKINANEGRPFAAVPAAELTRQPTLAALSREPAGRTITPATNYQLTENTTSFTVRTRSPGVVALQEAFWPGEVRAQLDGRDVPVLRLNHAFCGVAIESAGEHRLTFRYRPKNFGRNLALSGVGAALLIGSIAFVRRRTG